MVMRPPKNRSVNNWDAFHSFLSREAGPSAIGPGERLDTPRSTSSTGWTEAPARAVGYGRPLPYTPEQRLPGTERSLTHLYRGMSGEEWSGAQERGFIQSDMRGVISEEEGTNFGTDPRTAASYIPRGDPDSVIARVRVEPEDPYFTISADSYVRTREPVPVDRVERVVPLSKDQHRSVYNYPRPDRTPKLGRASR